MKALLKRIGIPLGICSAALGIEGFLLPNGFIDGGVMGVSMLLSEVTGVGLSVWVVLVNLPFLYMAYRQVHLQFALYSLGAIAALSVLLFMIHGGIIPFEPVTDDKLLAAFFGGVFLGGGIGLAMRSIAVLDGTEILALYLSRKSGVSIGQWILVMNLGIFTVAAFVLSLEAAMYSILTYFSASRTIDFILHGIEEYNGITIMTNEPARIRAEIISRCGRGVTIYTGKGGYSEEPREILFCVVTRLEIYRIKSIVNEIDPKAFLFTHSLNEASGGMIKKVGGLH